MKRKGEREIALTASDLTCWVTMVVFVVGLSVLAVRLWALQVTGAAAFAYENSRQSSRRVETAAPRGRILDRDGRVLAGNRRIRSLVCRADAFERKSWSATVATITSGAVRVAAVIGRPHDATVRNVRRHVHQSLAMPLVMWNELDDGEVARFCERAAEFPGFEIVESEARVYPFGAFASHLVGYVGRESSVAAGSGDSPFNFRERELRGRSGLERYYDGFLRGVPGEERVTVDARGFAKKTLTVAEPRRGLDLVTTIDAEIQLAAERQLRGEKGACVVLDPRDGSVLAYASAPAFDPNALLPGAVGNEYAKLLADESKPLVNRASGSGYAPGSTFKPVTALAGLRSGADCESLYDCTGVFALGGMRLHCARRWGHGLIAMRQALRDSCNTYFCNLGTSIGTNAVISAARDLGLGSPAGIDYSVDYAGVVPDGAWKKRTYGERWYPGDLAQMSIGQGMLLVTPLQMAMVAGAIGTGFLATPHVKSGLVTPRRPLAFSRRSLDIVREGMRMVVADREHGTGRRGGEGVGVAVAGKTGTAEIGRGETRRKNTWFIAYAPADAPTVAVAMVIENGESGGGTTAPRVAEVLKAAFADAGGGSK